MGSVLFWVQAVNKNAPGETCSSSSTLERFLVFQLLLACAGIPVHVPVMAVTTSVQPKSSQTGYAGSDFRHPIWFCFSTDSPVHFVQNQPGSILVLADCVGFWPNRSGPEASWCVRIKLANISKPIRIWYESDPSCLLGCNMWPLDMT